MLASLFPCSGDLAQAFDAVTKVAIGTLFFLHGAKLSREAIKAGATHWRLHACVLTITFVLFPLLGLAMQPLARLVATPDLYLGILFLCALPSTVQSSIALTAMARGNVPAAICSASASTMIGIFLTPALAGMLMATHASAGGSLSSVTSVVMQLLVPFVAGQIARRWIGRWVDRHKAALKFVDQGSILLVVYTAFSASVNQGLWERLPLPALAGLVVMIGILLAAVLMVSRLAARRLGFSTEDEVTVAFCGSQKSLASGVPIAKVLFTSDMIGAMVLPLMLYHQMQLMVCAVLAQRYARRGPSELDRRTQAATGEQTREYR
ncbi:bile acid:sodium symporter family protein [Massilia niastensis]|uniref:bile acid:sodium symporter family protein n=1 Tax=Massilia niastensis TaxID=544911 RepID=UPI00037CBC34|nr:bile acid:sodium symporter family protein [Massilia niastensis]